MATQTFTLEGQSYTVPHGTSMDELDEYIKGQKKGPSPEMAAAANPPKATPGPPMKQWSATGPDVTPLTQKQSDTAHTGAPSGVLGGMAGLAPVGIAEKGFAGYVAPLARNVAKSYLVSKGGEAVGRHYGGETGAEIGKWGGAVVGPMAIPDAAIARIPGAGAMFGNEELAGLRANMKVTQRAADVKAGLRKAPGGYPGVESGSATSGMTRMAKPQTPLIGSEEDWRNLDQQRRMLALRNKIAGEYHAAEGSTKNLRGLQERIGRRGMRP